MKDTAVLLISCPDRKGIVAIVANFLYQKNANILHADEHTDSELGLFFLRVEWEMNEFALGKNQFEEEFSPIAKEFQMDWKVAYTVEKPKVAIFVSREEHCLADLLYRYKSGELQCEIPVIISNHKNTKALTEFYGIDFKHVSTENGNKQEEDRILAIVKKYNIDTIVLARYIQILSENFLKRFAKPIINIHHSFLPAFVGARPYHHAYQRGVKIIGATAHYVTKEVDQGPIIEQDILRVSHRESVEDLIQKGRDIEKIVLSRAVRWHIDHRILQYQNKTIVFD